MTELDRRATDLGRRVLATAERLKAIAAHVSDDEVGESAAGLAERGARSLEQFGNYLQGSDGEALVRDAERFGRERPWAIATSGALLGFAGSRLLKASAARRYTTESVNAAATGTAGNSNDDASAMPRSAIGSLPPLSSEPMPILSPEPDTPADGLLATRRSEGQFRNGS